MILLVLTILFSIPFFNYQNYYKEPDNFQFNIQLLSNLQTNSLAFNQTYETFIKLSKDTHTPVIYILADGVSYHSGKIDSDRLRPAEKEIVSFQGLNNKDYVVVFDTRYNSRLQAFLGMG